MQEPAQRLKNPADNQHMILLYDNEAERVDAVTSYINEGLARNQLCVYGSVFIRDEAHLNAVEEKIMDYRRNIANGNLIILDMGPLYIAAMSDDYGPFEEVKRRLVEKVKNRADKHVRLVGDCVSFLFKNKHFSECLALEGWWQQKPFVGSYLCPYPRKILDSHQHSSSYKSSVLLTKHDTIVDIKELIWSSRDTGGMK